MMIDDGIDDYAIISMHVQHDCHIVTLEANPALHWVYRLQLVQTQSQLHLHHL